MMREGHIRRFVTPILAASFAATSFGAATGRAAAIPAYEQPDTATYAALAVLGRDGLLDGYPERSFGGDRPRTRYDVAVLVARAVARVQLAGVANFARTDLDALFGLVDAYGDELTSLGVPVTAARNAIRPNDRFSKFDRAPAVHGRVAVDESFRERTAAPHSIAGGSIDPFVNAFLTSPADDNPFEHDPGAGNRLRFDARFAPTLDVDENVGISLPVRIVAYDGPFSRADGYEVQAAAIANVAKLGALRNAYVRVGRLDNLTSSRLGLAYRAPDESQQGPGFQNPVQPYETGVALGGVIGESTELQLAYAQLDQSAIDTFPATGDVAAFNNYFLIATPSGSSNVQFGAPRSAGVATHVDSFVTSNAPAQTFYLSMKAALGTVYVSAVNGVTCTAGGSSSSGAPCPIRPDAYYFVDGTNQIVFRSALPVGSTVQVTYAVGNGHDGYPVANVQYARNHFHARIDHAIHGLPGTEVGFSFSRIVDAGNVGYSAGTIVGNGVGAQSDTVYGLDARVPLTFVPAGRDRSRAPVLFVEGAYSKYTPDLRNLAAVTDSALVVGLKVAIAKARLTAQYQNVGPDFFDGGTLRDLGPAPPTFGYYRGTFFPQFFGFANNLAINRIFSNAVTPGCVATACASANPLLTYAYPVFNPFEASGPQFFSAFAPNTRGLTGTLLVPIGPVEADGNVRLVAEHLRQVVPDSFAQAQFGPGFAGSDPLKFDRFEADLRVGVRVAAKPASLGLVASLERLYSFSDHKNCLPFCASSKVGYAYLPFNVGTGGPDPASTVANNAYLSGGATPVLFFPQYVDERHVTLAPSLTVPLARDFEFSIRSSIQTYGGANGTTLGNNIAERKSDTLATVSYRIPKTQQTIHVLFGNQKYTDAVVPTYNYNQNRESVDLTARF